MNMDPQNYCDHGWKMIHRDRWYGLEFQMDETVFNENWGCRLYTAQYAGISCGVNWGEWRNTDAFDADAKRSGWNYNRISSTRKASATEGTMMMLSLETQLMKPKLFVQSRHIVDKFFIAV